MQIKYLSEADALNENPAMDKAIISITEPGRVCPISGEWGAILRVTFCDAEYDQGTIDRMAARKQQFNPVNKGFPSSGSIEPIRGFISRLGPNTSELIVHCHAGQRRSAAVALYASEIISDAQFPRAEIARRDMNKTVYQLLKNPNAFRFHQRTSLFWRLIGWFQPARSH